MQDVEENARDSGRWRRGGRDGRRTVLWTCRLLLHNAQRRVHALRYRDAGVHSNRSGSYGPRQLTRFQRACSDLARRAVAHVSVYTT